MPRDSSYKKRCRKCKYSTIMHGIKYQKSVLACYYLGITGERRGCKASECDKYEPRKRGIKNDNN